MNEELTFKQKIIQFLYSIGLPPQRLLQGLICLLIIGVIAAVVFFSNFEGLGGGSRRADDVASTDDVIDGASSDTDDLDKQINELTFFDPSNFGYVVLYGEVQKQMDSIAEFRQRDDISAEQLKKLDGIQLRNLQAVAVRSIQADISSETEMKAFVDFAETLASSDDEKQRDSAGFSLVRTAAIAFTLEPNKSSATAAIETMKSQKMTLVNQYKRSDMVLGTFLKFKKQNPTNKFVDQCIQTLGQTVDTSTEPKSLELAETIREFGLFSNIQMSSIENRIRYNDPTGFEDLDKALLVVEANPKVKIETWQLLIRAYEACLSIGQLDNFSTAQKIVGDLVAKLPDSDPRKAQLSESLDRQKERVEILGKQFDLSGDSFDDRKITQSTKGFSVLCFADRSKDSAAMIQDLVKRVSNGIPFRPILAFKDDFTEQDREQINQIPRKLFAANRSTSLKYLRAFPCDNFPYLLLIDGNGVVASVNPSLLQAANRIASLQKKK